jgi:cGMP-dependent protein kinase
VRKLNEQLLSITPEARLGSSYSQLKANHYFDDLDWDRLYAKDLKAPVNG